MNVGSRPFRGWLLRMGIVVLVWGVFIGSLAGCGKKGAPVPPPDDPAPAKQETK